MVELADQYKDARDLSAAQATNKVKTFSKKVDQGKKPDPQVGENKSKFDSKNRFIPKSESECYKCHKFGHIAPECRSKTPSNHMSQVHNVGLSEQ